jgi:hypothetical protein
MSKALPSANLVVFNGRVFGWPAEARAIAVVGERIAYVGTDESAREWAGPDTELLDARGGSVLPGFIDAHVHFSSGGLGLSGIQLRDASTPDEFVRRVSEYAHNVPRGEWITGGRWNHELWPGAPLPARDWIDGVTPDSPVLVSRYDGHMCLANSLALRLAHITRDTPPPPGGAIEKGQDGEPTGILKDEAMGLVQRVIPEPSVEQLTRGIKAALCEAARYGVTGIHDNAGPREFGVYQQLYARGELTCRVYCMMPARHLESLVAVGVRAPFGNDWIRTGAVKAFADGSLGSSTALFFEPYADNPQNHGLPGRQMIPEEKMRALISEADRAGLQVCVHAIGDRANSMILDMYEAVIRADGGISSGRRLRIEHAQHLRPADIPRFASLGVVASVQPYHLVDDGCWAEKRIGLERCRTTYAFRSLLGHGARLAFGSDWPVAPLDPLLGIHAAVTRQTSDGMHPRGWFPEQKIGLDQAVEAYTLGSAFAEYAEDSRGFLAVGKLADIVLLDRDVSGAPAESLKDAHVACTLVGGRPVYHAH